MKTLILAILAASVITPALAKDRVTWWYEQASPDRQKQIDELLTKPFEAANPNVDLVIDYRGNELDKQLRVAMLSGAGPDIVYTAGPSYVAPMAQAGQLLPLDDYAKKYDWDTKIISVFLDMGRYNGKLYALPKTYETLGLFYNKTLFDEHDWQPPKTIAELETLADEMKTAGITPFAAGNADWRGANEWYVSLALNSIAGPDNVYKALTGEMPWTAQPFVDAVDTLHEWWEKGYFGKNYFSITSSEQPAQMLAAGKAGMMPSGTWNFQNVSTDFPEAKAEAGFVGFPSAKGDPVYPLGIGSTFSISAKSQQPDGAAKLIDFVFTPDSYSKMNSVWQGEWNMPLTDLSGVKMGDKVMPLYTDAMKTLASSVSSGNYGYTTWTFLPPATDSYLINGIEQVWLNKISTADYLAKMNATFQDELKEHKAPTVPER